VGGRQRERRGQLTLAALLLMSAAWGWVALAWWTEVQVQAEVIEVVVVAGQSKSKLRGAGPTRVTCARRQGPTHVCAATSLFASAVPTSSFTMSENLALTRALRCQVVAHNCRDFLFLLGNKWVR
jgi:hypothetical protein